MIGKILIAVVAMVMTALFEEHNMLPPPHRGANPGRSTDTEQDMLVEQIHVA
jgi:hypothetical protein